MNLRMAIIFGAMALVTQVASAADTSVPVEDWSGPYVVGFAGLGFGESEPNSFDLNPDLVGFNKMSLDARDTDTRFLIGGGMGYQWQSGQFLLGVEGDFTFFNMKYDKLNPDGTLSGGGPPFVLSGDAIAAGGGFLREESSLDWFGTLRPRLGYVVSPQFAVYGTGGLAIGHGSMSLSEANVATPGSKGTADDTLVGWTIGGGFDYRIDASLFLRAEYLYVDMSSDKVSIPFAGVSARTELDFQTHVVKLGLMYKFE